MPKFLKPPLPIHICTCICIHTYNPTTKAKTKTSFMVPPARHPPPLPMKPHSNTSHAQLPSAFDPPKMAYPGETAPANADSQKCCCKEKSSATTILPCCYISRNSCRPLPKHRRPGVIKATRRNLEARILTFP